MATLFGDPEPGNIIIEHEDKILTTFVENSNASTEK
jgi:hypothetical protein